MCLEGILAELNLPYLSSANLPKQPRSPSLSSAAECKRQRGDRWERAFAHGRADLQRVLDTGGDTPASVPADLVVQLASVDLLPLSGRFFCVGDDVNAKLRQAEEIVQRDLYTLRMRALANQPLVPWAAKAGFESMPSR